MMVEKRIGSLIRMDVESETKSCSSLLWDELDLLNYAIVVLYCTISRCVCSPQSKTRDMSVSRVYADVVEKMPPDYSDYEAVTIDWMSCCSVFHDDLGVGTRAARWSSDTRTAMTTASTRWRMATVSIFTGAGARAT